MATAVDGVIVILLVMLAAIGVVGWFVWRSVKTNRKRCMRLRGVAAAAKLDFERVADPAAIVGRALLEFAPKRGRRLTNVITSRDEARVYWQALDFSYVVGTGSATARSVRVFMAVLLLPASGTTTAYTLRAAGWTDRLKSHLGVGGVEHPNAALMRRFVLTSETPEAAVRALPEGTASELLAGPDYVVVVRDGYVGVLDDGPLQPDAIDAMLRMALAVRDGLSSGGAEG